MSDVLNTNLNRNRPGSGTFKFKSLTGALIEGDEGYEYVYTSKAHCIEEICAKMATYPTSRDSNYIDRKLYASDYNSWLNSTNYMFTSTTTKTYAPNGHNRAHYEVRRCVRWDTREGLIEIEFVGWGDSLKDANNRSCHGIWRKVLRLLPKVQAIDTSTEYIQEYELNAKWAWLSFLFKEKRRNTRILLPRVQINTEKPDKHTEQGDVTQESERVQNTIITRDQQETLSTPDLPLDKCDHLTSSEPAHTYPSFTQRWMPLGDFPVSTNDKLGTIVKTYFFPENFYALECAPNLTPFETFIYGRMNIELRVIVNANKFHVGKLLVSSKYDSYQADNVQSGYQAALARNHIILDLNANNEGVLDIPFRYHRPWCRLVKNDANTVGVRPSKYCSVYFHILSPLVTGPNGSSDIGIRVYYRFKTVEFTGMSYRVRVQGLGLETVLTPPTTRALKEILGGAERAFDQLGKTSNQDKPGVITGSIIIPQPRLNFCTGKGLIDVHPLRVNPHTLTNYDQINVPEDEPKSFYDLARIWGVYKEIIWTPDDKAGKELLTDIVDPMSRSYTSDFEGEPTPLEYACGNYMYWSGPIEIRFDFVSNSFHTGAVQISAEFGRKTGSTDECQSSSTYTKMFHLGEQKTVAFRIPYIYDTILRRTTAGIWNPYGDKATDNTLKSNALTIAPESRTFIKMRVINPLRPVAAAPQSIKILVFMRAGKQFNLRGLKAFSYIPNKNIKGMNNFPADGYGGKTRRNARSVTLDEIGQGLTKNINGTEIHVDDISRGITRRTTTTTPAPPVKDHTLNEWNETKPEYVTSTPPKVQMETGNKENQDTTDNFNEGFNSLTVQSVDTHLSFKDLLRRPYLIIDKAIVKPVKGGAWFIPLMPPTRDMVVLDKSNGRNSIWALTLGGTSAVSIMDLFRAWRGSLRYTFVVHKGDKPIFISLIPHSGVRLVGEHKVVDQDNFPIYGSNFTTEMLIPVVNPTMVVEAPYETENTWTLTFDDDTSRDYSWRDKGDTNAGHLAITTEEDVTLSVFWSAGDDFEFANFYGIPSGRFNGWAYRWNDEQAPRVQMDFLPEEVRIPIRNLTKSVMDPKTLTRVATSMIPIVGTPLTIANTISELENRVNPVIDNASELLSQSSQAVVNIETEISGLTHLLRETIDKITTTVTDVASYATLIYDFILDIILAWLERSWRVVAMGVIRFITKVFPSLVLNTWDSSLAYVEKLTQWFVSLFSQQTPRVQINNLMSSHATLTAILVGLVGTGLGVSLDVRRFRSFPLAVLERLTTASGASYMVSILRFVQSTFEVIKEYIMNALGYVSTEAQALRLLSEKQAVIKEFISEAQIITSEANSTILNRPKYRQRFWKCVLNAHQIQRIICSSPPNVVSANLGRLCSDVIKAGNEKFIDISASPVRYEPMVICIEGPSGIGKSHSTETLVSNLLTKIGFNNPTSENIYYRTAGEKYWSGYRDQPVIVYDEWLNTIDAQKCTEQIAEFMKLKSTSLFIPEMAHLEEKKIRGNPLLIIMLCNNAFPTLSDYARYPAAVYRRRDIVLYCERTPEHQGTDLREVPLEELVDYPHLQYRVYRNSSDHNSLLTDAKGFLDTQTWLADKFHAYHTREKTMVQHRMKQIPYFIIDENEQLHLEDPFTLFYGLNARLQSDENLSQNGWTPYEQLYTAVNQFSTVLDGHMERASQVTTQGPVTYILGLLTGSELFEKIARATRTQLLKLQEYLSPQRAELAYCAVCLETTPCAYICNETLESVGEARHLICAGCYFSNMDLGNGTCPTCRCQDMQPYVTAEDLEHLSVWARIANTGVRSVKWVTEQVLNYYSESSRMRVLRIMVDYVLSMMSLFFEQPNPSGYRGIHHGRIVRIGLTWLNSGAQVQANWEIDINIPLTSNGAIDDLEPSINSEAIDNCVLYSVPNPGICLHRHLRNNIASLRLYDDKWIVSDEITNCLINVPLHLCDTDCAIESVEDYTQIINGYKNMHKLQLRTSYINYINAPGPDTLKSIPVFYRTSWMKEVSIQVPVTWWDLLSEMWEKYKSCFKVIGVVTVTLGTIIQTYNCFAHLNPTGNTQASGAAVYSGENRVYNRTRNYVSRTGERRYFQGAFQDNPTIFEVVEKYIFHNTVQICAISGEGKCTTMYGTGLFNHYLLIPRHYSQFIKQRLTQKFKFMAQPLGKPQLQVQLNLTIDDFIDSTTTDLAYLHMPASFGLFKDLRKFIPTEREVGELPSKGILFANPSGGNEFMREIDIDILGISDRQVILDMEDKAFEVRDVVVYNYSKPGVCGSLLLRENHQKPIVSMHFAGVGEGITGEGFGIILTRESLGALCQMENIPGQFEDKCYQSVEEAKFIYETDIKLDYLGTVDKGLIPYIPTKTKLCKSQLYGYPQLVADQEPAILSAQDTRYIHDTTPLWEGVKAHGKLTLDFPRKWVLNAAENLWDISLSKMVPLVTQPRVLSMEQAVVGFLGMEYYQGMDVTTSAGYPFVCGELKKDGTSKEKFMDLIRDSQNRIIGVKSFNPILVDIMEHKESLRKRGIIPHTIFIDTLKDEKRKHAKVMKLGGTRVFCNSPMDYVIDCRRYFMHFIAAFMDQRSRLMHAVGINPMSEEWTSLGHKLLRRNTNIITLDYSNFGPGYNAGVAEAAYELMIKWTIEHVKDIDPLVIRCVVWECIHSIHIVNNTVYQQSGGSPSGAVFTTVVNSIVNQLYIIIAWQQLVGRDLVRSGYDSMEEWRRNIELYTYGDDLIMAVSDTYVGKFNAQTITKFFANYGIVATSADKTSEIQPTIPFFEATFLKRQFLPHPNNNSLLLSPLDTNSIYGATQWVWRSANNKEATYINCEAALLQAHGHGKEWFMRFKDILNTALRRARMQTLTLTWDEIDMKFFSGGINLSYI